MSKPTSKLAAALAASEAAGAEIGWLDIRELPFCDGRRDSYGERVDAFRASVHGADALLIGSPEYHGSMTGSLKNAFDLLGPEELRGTLVGLLATARGDSGAMNTLNHLRHVARWMNAWVLPTQVSVPRANERFSEDGVPDPDLGAELDKLGGEMVRYAGLFKGA